MIKFNPLPNAPEEYSRQEESLFRRSVENSMISAYSALEDAISAQSGLASPASKRETLILGDTGMSMESGFFNVAFSDNSNSATPNVQGLRYLVMENSSSVNVTDFLGGCEGQELTVFSYQAAGLVIVYDSTKIVLDGNANLDLGSTASELLSNVTLRHLSGVWVETSRMVRA